MNDFERCFNLGSNQKFQLQNLNQKKQNKSRINDQLDDELETFMNRTPYKSNIAGDQEQRINKMEKNIEEIFGSKRSNALVYGSYKTKDPYDELH
jgi:hypothetical protein